MFLDSNQRATRMITHGDAKGSPAEDPLTQEKALIISSNFQSKGAVYELAMYLKGWQADRVSS